MKERKKKKGEKGVWQKRKKTAATYSVTQGQEAEFESFRMELPFLVRSHVFIVSTKRLIHCTRKYFWFDIALINHSSSILLGTLLNRK
jgi:hypothetical protein